eukprot:Nk52_evm47s248 gene=Nk52_evmTU47s248
MFIQQKQVVPDTEKYEDMPNHSAADSQGNEDADANDENLDNTDMDDITKQKIAVRKQKNIAAVRRYRMKKKMCYKENEKNLQRFAEENYQMGQRIMELRKQIAVLKTELFMGYNGSPTVQADQPLFVESPAHAHNSFNFQHSQVPNQDHQQFFSEQPEHSFGHQLTTQEGVLL